MCVCFTIYASAGRSFLLSGSVAIAGVCPGAAKVTALIPWFCDALPSKQSREICGCRLDAFVDGGARIFQAFAKVVEGFRLDLPDAFAG